jgi:hypothetical protein
MVPTSVRAAAAVCTAIVALTACARTPVPSHVDGNYRGRLDDDILVEASTTVLVTNKPVVIALRCVVVAGAIAANDDAAIDRAVAAGVAARIPSGVTLYSLPFSPQNPKSSPLVVTDDKHAGTLCTPQSYDVVKS